MGEGDGRQRRTQEAVAAAAGPGTATFLPITNPPPTHQPSQWHRKQASLLQTRLMSHPLPPEVLPLLLPLPMPAAVGSVDAKTLLRPLQQQPIAVMLRELIRLEEVAYAEKQSLRRSVFGSKPSIDALGSASSSGLEDDGKQCPILGY